MGKKKAIKNKKPTDENDITNSQLNSNIEKTHQEFIANSNMKVLSVVNGTNGTMTRSQSAAGTFIFNLNFFNLNFKFIIILKIIIEASKKNVISSIVIEKNCNKKRTNSITGNNYNHKYIIYYDSLTIFIIYYYYLI